MTEVARAADVSPATVTNHFATPDLLLEAVVARLIVDIQVPDRSIFDGTKSLAARIRALTGSMFAFYERTSRWFNLLGTELTEVRVLARAEADFRRSMQRLYAEALSGTDDTVLAKTTAGLIHPATYGALRATGLSLDEATAVVADSLTHLARKARK
jgi:AcrR family transcriptional regulator